MLPEAKQRQEAQAAFSAEAVDPSAHLNAIQMAAEKRSRNLLMKLKAELGSIL